MKNVYKGFPGITAASIERRIECFKEAGITFVTSESCTIEELQKQVEICQQSEMYEASQGFLLAIAELKASNKCQDQ